MTINKSQGQTLDRVGIYLDSPVFSHGQLYVGCSRVRKSNTLFFQITNSNYQGEMTINGVTAIYVRN